ncbi:MAG TPA: hypothetical protein DHW82_05000 [Spirochaetia bacterium]|nr:hypothetical protein [Spirochaetia bacterium]
MKNYAEVLANIEKFIGLDLEKIKQMTPTSFRIYLEKKNKRKLFFKSEFPFIGRGNVLRDGIIGRNQINAEIDAIIGF